MFNRLVSKINIQNEDSLSANISMQNFLRVRKYERNISNTCIFYICYLFCTVYTLNQVVYLIMYFDFDIFTRYIQFFMLPLGLLKILFYHKNGVKWENIIEMVSMMENESSSLEDDHTKIVVQYKKYCHFVTYLFNIVAASLISLIVVTFWTSNIFFQNPDNIQYIVIYKILLPFDDSTFRGQIMSMILQSVYTVVSTSYVCCWDGLIITLMVFLSGQLRALRQRCVSALNFDNELICLQNIAKCHKHFMDTIQCFKMVNDMTSFLMFMYLLTVSINTGIVISMLTQEDQDIIDIMSALMVFLGLMFQSLFTYYVANEVIVQSENLLYGVFESSWSDRSVCVQKHILMLAVGMNRRVAFSAGPFSEMSLATFMSILQASYSYYTLLS